MIIIIAIIFTGIYLDMYTCISAYIHTNNVQFRLALELVH